MTITNVDGVNEASGRAARGMDGYTSLLRQYFGFTALHMHQKEVLESLASGSDCLAVLPTGSGKSLCYVLPALANDGLTLVISPLIALIRDQVQRYQSLGISCAALDSLQSQDERRDVWEKLEHGALKLLYLSPERLASVEFRQRLKRTARLSLVAVDEAHCISQWGSQFRPEYRKLRAYLEDFPRVQKLALTATATAKVRKDMIQGLNLVEPKIINVNPMRENLNTKVLRLSGVEEQLTALLNAVLSTEGQGIIYCTTRRGVGEIATMIRNAGQSISVYHAGLTAEQRQENQRAFASGQTRMMAATNAFGMGIDKKDIRFVFHAGMPASLEAYVQEIGRAGRDGEPARCYLFYSGRDVHIQRFLIEKSFPEPKYLKQALERVYDALDLSVMLEERDFLTRFYAGFSAEKDELMLALKTLFREGVLSKKLVWDVPGGRAYIQRHELTEDLETFIQSVQSRRQEQLAKLAVMSEFVSSEVSREAILHRYFEL